MGKRVFWRALALLLCAFGVLALTGCGGDAEKEKIVYLTHNDKAVFGSLIKREFDKIARKNGYTVEYLDAQGNADRQIAQFEEAVKGGAKYVVLLAVDEKKIVAAAEEAAEAGVCVIPVNRHVRTAKLVGVYSDEYGAGELQAAYMARNLPTGASVFYLQGTGGQLSSQLRWEGFRDGCLEKRPDIRLVDSQDGNYSREQARRIAEAWARNYVQIDAVVCANDEMALGALEALKDAHHARGCMIAGIDATADALDAIAAGEIRMTIKQDAQRQAQGAYQLLEDFRAGKVRQSDLKISLFPVTKENLAQFRK
ncbi:MAG: sugar ABC transporter substrate-binding protein [Schwartzia sp.]|nr:sugar ABC transporter substrate-binding protein [Schwartzia sp. (in: firmicutes)]